MIVTSDRGLVRQAVNPLLPVLFLENLSHSRKQACLLLIYNVSVCQRHKLYRWRANTPSNSPPAVHFVRRQAENVLIKSKQASRNLMHRLKRDAQELKG